MIKILDSSSSSGLVYKLSSEQKEIIKAEKKQISEGKYITNEILEKEEDKWLIIWSLKARDERQEILEYWHKRNGNKNYSKIYCRA